MLKENSATDKLNKLRARLSAVITSIDRQISSQLHEVIRHDSYRDFEANWRSLAYLIKQKGNFSNIKINILPLSRAELRKDLTQVPDFDYSELFKKIYNHGFGMAGGEPFNVIIGAYEFANKLFDIEVLKVMSEIATAAFAPFIAGAAPSLLGITNFDELGRMPELHKIFEGVEYKNWRKLRMQEEIRFVSLVLPHHLLRLPYRHSSNKSYFQYRATQTERDYLWGNAAFAFVAMLISNFKNNAWFTSITDKQDLHDEINIASVDLSKNINDRLTPELPVDAVITDNQERSLREQGFMSLCIKAGTNLPIFYSCPSLQQIVLNNEEHKINYRTSSLLNYLFCACRFVHYLKMIARDKIGSFATIDECTEYLNFWLTQYAAANTNLDFSQRVKFPLQAGYVKVTAQPMRADFYFCTIYIKPFFQLEQLRSEFIFITELNFKTNNKAAV